ncbi:MAG: molybdopterin-binding protein [Halosimplex sp.]
MNETRRPVPERATVAAVRERVREATDRIDRTERLPVSTAVGRPLAAPVVARRPVPGYEQVARDGVAVRAADTADASEADPTPLAVGDGVERGSGVRVDAGGELPAGADAVVGFDGIAGVPEDAVADGSPAGHSASTDVAVTGPVEPGDGVRPAGSDVDGGETVRPAGHRLTASDPALCTAVGRTRVEVVQRPTVGILPVGDGMVASEPGPGETVETDGTTVAEFVERRGGKVTYRDPVEPDPHALRAAVERDLTKDLLVTVGATGAGESDRIVEVVADLGAVLVDGVALERAATTTLSVVRERPVLSIPGDPVAALVATDRVVEPAVARLAGRSRPDSVTLRAALVEPVASPDGVESVVPVEIGSAESAAGRTALPVDDDPLSTLARADGWVTVPADRSRLAAGETVSVERREASV